MDRRRRRRVLSPPGGHPRDQETPAGHPPSEPPSRPCPALESQRRRFAVEWNRQPALRIDRAFAAVVKDARLNDKVTPHVLRHTAVTWAMQNAADRYQGGEYFGLSQELLERRYGHHHPDYLGTVADAITGRPPTGRPQIERNKTRKIVDLVGEIPRSRQFLIGDVRSGRGGRKFKSCHSDQHLGRARILSPARPLLNFPLWNSRRASRRRVRD